MSDIDQIIADHVGRASKPLPDERLKVHVPVAPQHRHQEVALHLGRLATRGTIQEMPPIRRQYGRAVLGAIGMAVIVLALTALAYGWR